MATDMGRTIGVCRECGDRVVVTRNGIIRHGDCPGAGKPPRAWVMNDDAFKAATALIMDRIDVDGAVLSVEDRTFEIHAHDQQVARLSLIIRLGSEELERMEARYYPERNWLFGRRWGIDLRGKR